MNEQEIGRLLRRKLDETKDVVAISRWAFRIYNDNLRELPPKVKHLLLDLARMEDAPEFEHSHLELIAIADTLRGAPNRDGTV
jgi:hypothetical protein